MSLAEPYCPSAESIYFIIEEPARQIITARIMQDVPLANGGKIREGSKVIGHGGECVVSAEGDGGKLSCSSDKLISSGRTIPIRTI